MRNALGKVTALVVLFLAGGCATVPLGATRTAISGTVSLESISLGQQTIAPVVCNSGEHQMFLGADFIDPDHDLVIRLIVEPTGDVILRAFPKDGALEPGTIFRRDDCSELELDLEHTGWQINDIHELAIDLDAVCRNRANDEIEIRVRAASCH